MTGKYKRMLLLNLPYVLIALLGTKLGDAWRYSPGLDISQKVLHLMDGLALAFQSPWLLFSKLFALNFIIISQNKRRYRIKYSAA